VDYCSHKHTNLNHQPHLLNRDLSIYGGTAIIASKDKTQAQQKRYRYTGKERDDSNGLCYYGARYLAPWLAIVSFALCLVVRFNHSAGSIALVIINIVFYDVDFVGFSELVKGVVVVPI
jgi:hypothetical protein